MRTPAHLFFHLISYDLFIQVFIKPHRYIPLGPATNNENPYKVSFLNELNDLITHRDNIVQRKKYQIYVALYAKTFCST